MHHGFMGHIRMDREQSYRIRNIDKKVIGMFLKYLKPHTGILIMTLLATSVVALVNMAAPYLSKVAIDDFILAKNITGLHLILGAFVVLYGIFWLASYWGSFLTLKLGQRIVANIRRDLFKHVSSLSLDFFSDNKTGQIMSRMTNDINALADFVSGGVINLVSDVLTLAGVITIMFVLNVKLASVVLVLVPIIFIGILLIGKHMRKAYGNVRENIGKLNAGVEENLSGIRVVKAMSQESGNMVSFEKLNKDNLFAHIKAILISALVFPFLSLTGTLGTALVVLAGGIMIINGEAGATIGTLMAFIGYTNRFFMPLRDMSQLYGLYQTAAASAERIYGYFSIKPSILSPDTPKVVPEPIRGDIGFSDVGFGYEPERPVLADLNAVIPSMHTIAIVGPTGAGKSTMIKLLTRLYDVDRGAITIDGIDIRDIGLPSLRRMVMLVPQDVFLFTGTVKENIGYGNPDATDDEIIKAAVNACADPFIRNLSDGYETQVGEGGIMLSGGQRQLIAFARAILADRPILILDEATSSVDAATEVLIQEALERLLKDRTSIIIAHRFTTLRKADKIIVLDEGKIAGYDSHEALLENCGLYKSLFEKQWLS